MEREIDLLLNKLSTIQQEVGKDEGAKENSSTGKKEHFYLIKESIVESLQMNKDTIADLERFSKKTHHPRETIQKQQQLREGIRRIEQQWQELKSNYEMEAKKKRSKLSHEELTLRFDVVQLYAMEIQKQKDEGVQAYLQRTPASGGNTSARGNGPTVSPAGGAFLTSPFHLTSPDEETPANGSSKANWASELNSTTTGEGKETLIRPDGSVMEMNRTLRTEEEITAGQQNVLQKIDQRDEKFDEMITEIGQGVHELNYLSKGIHEEVSKQNVMLEGLDTRIDNASKHSQNVNQKIKDVMQSVTGGADRFMMSVICIIILLGVLAVAYNMVLKPRL